MNKIIEQAGYDLNKNVADPMHKEKLNARIDNSNMSKILKIEPTDIKKSTLDIVKSFFDYGIVKK